MKLNIFPLEIIRKITSYLYFNNKISERIKIHEDIREYHHVIYNQLRSTYDDDIIMRRIIRWICFELPMEESKKILDDIDFQIGSNKTRQHTRKIMKRLKLVQLVEMFRVCKLYTY
jgi:hypothetical protein